MDTSDSGLPPPNNGPASQDIEMSRRAGLDVGSPSNDNDEDVGASLRSLQKESEEEVNYLYCNQ